MQGRHGLINPPAVPCRGFALSAKDARIAPSPGPPSVPAAAGRFQNVAAIEKISVGASVGLSISPHEGEDMDTLPRNADTAMCK